MPPFVHLHTHSHYSLLDGLPKIHEMVAKAKEFGCPALALTDHGVMYGALEFYQECRKQGIKPIIGMEAYMALSEKEEKRAGVDKDYHHLTLLARNEEGYRNLMMLTTIAHLEGYYYKPRIDKAALRTHGKGLIALSGCLRGEIPRLIVAGKYDEAKAVTREFQEIFGKENFFAEVQKHPELPQQETVNNGMFQLCKELGMLAVATVDSHYLHYDDAEAQDVLVCVQTGKLTTEKDRLNMTGTDLSFRSPDEIAAQWAEMPEVLSNTLKVADACNLEIALNKWAFPQFPVPEGKSHIKYLREIVLQAAEERFGHNAPQPPSPGLRPPSPRGRGEGEGQRGGISDEVQTRINYELDVIERTGFATYFLIVSDYVKWARSQGIVVTTRGSAAGSIVSYLIDVTTVNPLDFRLPFERFLTVSRPTPPDIDVDFADNRRDEVIEYVRQKYGRDKVAQIVTFGTMLPRAAVRDVTRVLGLPYSFGDKLSKMIPPGAQGFHMTVDRAMVENPELGKLYHDEAEVRRVLDLARKVEGCVRHASVHAAGMVISPTKLTDFTPLQKEAQGDNIITQYDMHAVESAGLVKMDMLGIRNLSILGDAVEIVKKTKGVQINIDKLPPHDKKTFEMLSRGDTMGVFQLGGSGMTRYLKELKPSSIDDIMAMVALFRPGPMESIPEYIRRKHNPRLVSYLDPRLKSILERTFGILVYQDDVLYIAIEIAGYSWEEADKLRKAMGKKIPKEMMAQREKFLLGCVRKDMSRATAEALWALIEPFAAYGFNKSHAASYGMVAYQTAYMKAHFPSEFVAAILTAEAGNIDKVAEVISGARESGITVLPPDVNESNTNFTYVDDATIRFGLLAIKNLGSDVVEAVINERTAPPLTPPRKGGEIDKRFPPLPEGRLGGVGVPFSDLEDFLKRVQHKNLNKKSLESLVKSGAMDRFADRGVMLDNMEVMLAFNRSMQEAPTKQASLFAGQSIARVFKLKDGPPAPKEETLRWERELLGLYVSSHPLYEFEEVLRGKTISSEQLAELRDGTAVCLAGVLAELKKRFTKNGEAMLTARLQDLKGSCELVVFPKAYKVYSDVLQDGALICVWGKGGGEEKRILCDRAMPLTRENIQNMEQGAVRENRRTTPNPSSTRRGNETISSPARGGVRRGGSGEAEGQRIYISLISQDRTILETLRTFFASTMGDCPVYIVLNQNGERRTIETSFYVDPAPAVVQSLESIVGAGMVKVV